MPLKPFVPKTMPEHLLNLDDYIAAQRMIIEDHLNVLVPNKSSLPYQSLFQAARYSLLNGGKRIRPLLTLAVCECLNGNI
jgi:geranylgeranyl diphosphate synthase type II